MFIKISVKMWNWIVAALVVGGVMFGLQAYAADSIGILSTPLSRCGNIYTYATGTATYANVSTGRLLMVFVDGVKVYQNEDRPTAWSTNLFSVTAGTHTVDARIYRRTSGPVTQSLAARVLWNFTVSECSGGGDGGGDGGGGGGGGGEESSTPVAVRVVRTFQPERGHVISGNYSGVVGEGSRKVVRLANDSARLEKKITVPQDNWWLEITAKHDRPGPVKVAIYINKKYWKTISLNRNDDKYRTVRVGLLRRFRSGTVRFRFLNDTYDRRDPSNPKTDRNFYLDSWRLVSGG